MGHSAQGHLIHSVFVLVSFMLSGLNKPFMLSVAMLSAIMPSVVALKEWGAKHCPHPIFYHSLFLSPFLSL
jgi:hypothetical protein